MIEKKIAFITKYDHSKYQKIVVRLFNIPINFQNYFYIILIKKLNNFVIVYLDDILISTLKALVKV